jgi:hypothetical protein
VTLTDASLAMPTSINPWSGAFTVEAWVMPLATPGWRNAIVVDESYQVNGFRLGYDAQLHPVFWTSESGGTTELTASAAMSMNSWHHVAAVRSGTTVTLVVNGVAAGTATNVSYLPPAAGTTFLLGAGTARFVWNDGSRTFAQFQAAGQDVTGSVDGNVTGGMWSCATS